MVIKIGETYGIINQHFSNNILGNDYIALILKVIKEDELKKIFDSLRLNSYLRTCKTPLTRETISMPVFAYIGDFYSHRGFEIEKYFRFNDRLALLSLDTSELKERDLRSIFEEMITKKPISRLLDHMKSFIENKKISEYKVGSEELMKDINEISNNIIDYIRNKYPDAVANEEFLDHVNRRLWLHLLSSIERSRTKIIDNCYSLLESPIIIRIRGVEIKLDRLIELKLYYDEERYSKRTKNFIINATISSFIKVLPINLWQLQNKDALSILVKPKIEYTVVPQDRYGDLINSTAKSKANKASNIFLKPHYYLVLIIDHTLLNRVKPIIISMNITGLSFLLKSKSIKDFLSVLNHLINNVYKNVINEFPHSNLLCSRLSI